LLEQQLARFPGDLPLVSILANSPPDVSTGNPADVREHDVCLT
jgi:hypothetical protein